MLASSSVFVLGGVVPFIMYVMMLRLAWKFRHSEKTGMLDRLDDRARRVQIIKSEQRAMITFFVLFLTLVGLTLPFYSVLLVDQIGAALGSVTRIDLELFYFILDVYLLLPIGDAIIIAWNRDIKERVREIFTLKRATRLVN